MVTADEEKLAELINRKKTASKELGLCINTSKTNVMVIDEARCLLESDVLKEYDRCLLGLDYRG